MALKAMKEEHVTSYTDTAALQPMKNDAGDPDRLSTLTKEKRYWMLPETIQVVNDQIF